MTYRLFKNMCCNLNEILFQIYYLATTCLNAQVTSTLQSLKISIIFVYLLFEHFFTKRNYARIKCSFKTMPFCSHEGGEESLVNPSEIRE